MFWEDRPASRPSKRHRDLSHNTWSAIAEGSAILFFPSHVLRHPESVRKTMGSKRARESSVAVLLLTSFRVHPASDTARTSPGGENTTGPPPTAYLPAVRRGIRELASKLRAGAGQPLLLPAVWTCTVPCTAATSVDGPHQARVQQ